jgi:peptidoglycan/LPS O-acetylase OafA/YrhL
MIPHYELTTRAWELALGGLVALGTRQLKRLPTLIAALMTWVRLGGILVAGFIYTLGDPAYPGAAVALPVVSAAMLIAGGSAAPSFGVELLLKLAPFKWLGRWSYSIYLWHYPLLIIPGEKWQYPTLTRQLGLIGSRSSWAH